MDDKLRSFYLFLLVLGVLLLLLTGLGHFWLGKLQTKMAEDEQARLESARHKHKGTHRIREVSGTSGAGTPTGSNRTHTEADPVVDLEAPADIGSVGDERARFEEIMQELQDKKPPQRSKDDRGRVETVKDCAARLERIGDLLLQKWVPQYGVGVYYPCADPEGALRTAAGRDIENLLRCACNPKAGRRFVLLADLPRDVLQLLSAYGILACEPGPNYEGNRNVLFRDGRVETLSEKQFQTAIEKQETELRGK